MQNSTLAELLSRAQSLAGNGLMAQAAALYGDWVLQHPDDPLLHVAHFNRGVLLGELQDLAGAAAAFTEAIRRNPGFLPPYINLGNLHERAGAAEAALAHWQHAIASLAGVTPEAIAYKTTALKQTARLLESQQRYAAAEAALRQIIELGAPEPEVLQHWISLRQRQCLWPLLPPLAGLDRAALKRRMAPLSLANAVDDPLLQLAGAAAYLQGAVGQPREFRATADFRDRARPPDGRLRIGYLSSDLRDHAIGHLMADLFHRHDRTGFEVFVYYCGIPQEDATKHRIRASVEHWLDITPLDDEAALRRMLADGIDILVDVNGHTRDGRPHLLARRPAPVIVNWLGFPGSMGSPCHHYIIADPVIIPPEHEHYYSERVLRLPCYQPTDRNRPPLPPPPSRAEAGLPEGAMVYCSFNGTQKITPFVLARWMEILRQVPDSVLWLLRSNEETDRHLHRMAEQAGLAPGRLVFAPFLPNAEHLARYALADLFLDSAPYNAHTTASDALWMGTPVLTWPGLSFAARVGASLVRAAGLPELVCASAEEYVRQAVALGRDRPRLAALRARLLAGREGALLFDTALLVRELEELFRAMWQEFEEDSLPRPDLTNLDHYLEIGAALNHEQAECTDRAAYEQRYRAALARRHAFSPLPPDRRLWPLAETLSP